MRTTRLELIGQHSRCTLVTAVGLLATCCCQVSSVELERVVLEHLNRVVLEAAAVGVPTPGGGPELLHLFLVLHPSAAQQVAGTPGGKDAEGLAQLQQQCQAAVRTGLNPLFKVDKVSVLGCGFRWWVGVGVGRQLLGYVLRRRVFNSWWSASSTSTSCTLQAVPGLSTHTPVTLQRLDIPEGGTDDGCGFAPGACVDRCWWCRDCRGQLPTRSCVGCCGIWSSKAQARGSEQSCKVLPGGLPHVAGIHAISILGIRFTRKDTDGVRQEHRAVRGGLRVVEVGKACALVLKGLLSIQPQHTHVQFSTPHWTLWSGSRLT